MCRPTLYRETRRRARKTHMCVECRTDIRPGETYMEASGLWDGEFDTIRWCLCCNALKRMVLDAMEYPDEYLIGKLLEDAREMGVTP